MSPLSTWPCFASGLRPVLLAFGETPYVAHDLFELLVAEPAGWGHFPLPLGYDFQQVGVRFFRGIFRREIGNLSLQGLGHSLNSLAVWPVASLATIGKKGLCGLRCIG